MISNSEKSLLSTGDANPHVSLCAMCSDSQAAVRWNMSEQSNIVWRAVGLTYECTGNNTVSV